MRTRPATATTSATAMAAMYGAELQQLRARPAARRRPMRGAQEGDGARIVLHVGDEAVEVPLPSAAALRALSYAELLDLVRRRLQSDTVVLNYVDDDMDLITITNDDDLAAYRCGRRVHAPRPCVGACSRRPPARTRRCASAIRSSWTLRASREAPRGRSASWSRAGSGRGGSCYRPKPISSFSMAANRAGSPRGRSVKRVKSADASVAARVRQVAWYRCPSAASCSASSR